MKHTKGKWTLERTGFTDETDFNSASNSTKYYLKTDEVMNRKRHLIANVVGSEEEAEANANLIASAPELLRTIKPLIARIKEMDSWAKGYDQIKEAENAIAKAEGK